MLIIDTTEKSEGPVDKAQDWFHKFYSVFSKHFEPMTKKFQGILDQVTGDNDTEIDLANFKGSPEQLKQLTAAIQKKQKSSNSE